MTAMVDPTAGAPRARTDGQPCAQGFEVSTTSGDALRASVRVVGPLTTRTCPLLLSVLTTHLRAGRRYLRVDLADTVVDDLGVLEPLRDTHDTVVELGGMLVFDNAGDDAVRVLTRGDLFVSPPD